MTIRTGENNNEKRIPNLPAWREMRVCASLAGVSAIAADVPAVLPRPDKRACRASREELLHNALPTAFFSKSAVDVLLLSRSEDVYAVGATYEADAKTRNLAAHRSLYLSLLGDELAAGEARRTQMRMIS